MSRPTPNVGVPLHEPSGYPDAVRAAGGEPAPLPLPPTKPGGGVALAREWVADAAEISCGASGLDALLLSAKRQEELFGMLLAAVRLGLPTVCAPLSGTPLAAALTALGLAPVSGDASSISVELVADGGPRPGELLDNFSLANAVRAGVAAGGGPELLVHISALAREAGVPGFAQMVRVLAPETPAADPEWTRDNGVPALLASLGDGLHDVPTVAGGLKRGLPPAPPVPEHRRLVFVRARASGAEVVCQAPPGASEVAGECRVYGSEAAAVRALGAGSISADAVMVVQGCGPRGGAGLLRLDGLGAAIREAGICAAVITDGLPPEDPPGTWASLFTPEAAMGGVIGRLRDGDTLRLDLERGRIRAGIEAGELAARDPFEGADQTGPGYAARYARSALPALEGAGFG